MRWFQVLDHSSSAGQTQFAAPQKGWVFYKFQTGCASKTWKIDNFISHKNGKHTFMFEAVYVSSTVKPPPCTDTQQVQYGMHLACLPQVTNVP